MTEKLSAYDEGKPFADEAAAEVLRDLLPQSKTSPEENIAPSTEAPTSSSAPSVKVRFGQYTLGENKEIATDPAHDAEAKRIQFGKVEDGVTPHPYQTRDDTAYDKVVEVARRELYTTEKAAGEVAAEETKLSTQENTDPFLADEGKIYYFQGNSAISQNLALVRKGDRYHFLDHQRKEIPGEGATEEAIRSLAQREVWQPITGEVWQREFILNKVAEQFATGLHENGQEKQVIEIKEGDIWVREIEKDGKTLTEKIIIESVNENGFVLIHREDVTGFQLIDDSEVSKLQEELERDGYKKDAIGKHILLISTPEPQSPEPEPARDSVTLEQLLSEIPDGAEFVLVSKTGKTKEKYHRQGDKFLSVRDGVVTENVLARLNKGWTFEMKDDEAPQSSKQENRDLLKGRDPKDYSQILPGDVWVLRTAKGQVLDRLQVNYTLKHGPEVGEIIQTSSSWEKSTDEGEVVPGFYPSGLEWRKNKFQDKLQSEGYVLEVAGEVPKTEPRKKDIIDHLKETDPYSRINSGDVWELRSPTGEQIERVYVEEIIEKKKRGKQEMWVEVEMEYSKTARIAKEKKQEQWQKFPLESFRKKLQDDGYVLITRGNGAELDYGGSFDWNAKLKEEKERYDPLGLPKKEDEWVRYTTASEEVEVNYDSVSNLYTVARVEDGGTIGTYTEGNIRRLAELENWEKIGGESERPKIEPSEPPKVKNPEQKPQESPLILPQGSEELYYRAANGSEFKVRKDAGQEGVYVLIAMATLQERGVSKEELETLAEHNQWKQIEKPELVGPEPLDLLIEKSQAVVEEARTRFVQAEATQGGKWKALKMMFRLKEETAPEVQAAWEEYQNNLVKLQGFQIEKIKGSGAEGKELKQLIAGMIREYDFEEAERIDNAKRELRLSKEKASFKERMDERYRNIVKNVDERWPDQQRWERFARIIMRGELALAQTFAESLVIGAKKVGVGYNKLVSTKGGKITMTAAGVAAFGTAMIFSGGAAATMAGFLLAAKRAAAGAGLAVAAEGLTDYGAKVLRSRKTNKNIDKFFNEEKDDQIITLMEKGEKAAKLAFEQDSLKRLEAFLKKDVNSKAYEKSVKRDRNHLYRKTGAVLAGVLFGNSSFVGNLFSEAQAATPTGSEGGMEKVAEIIERETPSVPKETVMASPEVGSNGTNALLQEKVVSSGDTITKYAVTSGETMGLQREEGKRFAALLREKLNEKLVAMDPEAAKAAGFVPNKDGVLTADFIRAGEKVDLGKILSSDEMKALAEQAKDKTVSPAVPPVEVSAPTSQAVLTETARVLKEAGIAPASAAPAVGETLAQPTPDAIREFDASQQKVTEYIKTLPQAEQVEMFRTMRGTMRDLFNTPEISIYGNYDMNYDLKEHPEMAKASMARVLEDHKTLSSRAFYMYDRSLNPLHWTQMQELAKFTEGASKVLGKEVSTPLKRESIEEYILRLALLAKESGKSFPGLHMVK